MMTAPQHANRYVSQTPNRSPTIPAETRRVLEPAWSIAKAYAARLEESEFGLARTGE